MIEYFLLNKDQIIGKNKLEIINNQYISNEATDFAYYKSRESGVPNRCDNWWVGMGKKDILPGIINAKNDNYLKVNPNFVGYGIRPAVKYEYIKPFAEDFYKDNNTMLVRFGKYPQNYASPSDNILLDNVLTLGYMQNTKKPNVYRYDDSYYIKDLKTNKWIIESPLLWVVDCKTGIAVCDKIIDSGNKNYKEVVDFLNNSFGRIVLSEKKEKEYHALNNYNLLLSKKKEAEERLDMINKLLINVEDEIQELKRKKN